MNIKCNNITPVIIFVLSIMSANASPLGLLPIPGAGIVDKVVSGATKGAKEGGAAQLPGAGDLTKQLSNNDGESGSNENSSSNDAAQDKKIADLEIRLKKQEELNKNQENIINDLTKRIKDKDDTIAKMEDSADSDSDVSSENDNVAKSDNSESSSDKSEENDKPKKSDEEDFNSSDLDIGDF